MVIIFSAIRAIRYGKHLRVPAKLGKPLKIKLHRPLEGTPVTAHLVLRADGHWYALIVCETTPQDALRRDASYSRQPASIRRLVWMWG